MGLDVALPESLDKYGLFGMLVFALTAAGAASFWKAIIGLFEQQDKPWKERMIRPIATSILFLVPLTIAAQIVSAKNSSLDRAAEIINGRWALASRGCRYGRNMAVEKDRGILAVQTLDGFRFFYDIEAIDQDRIQVRLRGSDQVSIYRKRGATLDERLPDGQVREMIPC